MQLPPLPPNATLKHVPIYLTDITREVEYQKILPLLPASIRHIAERYLHELDEIKMDAGKPVQFRHFGMHIRHGVIITQDDLNAIEVNVNYFKVNGRKGVKGTTHRVSASHNDFGTLDKITFRVGRLLRGVAEPFRDVIQNSRGIGICGRSGSGKTTLLRDAILIDGESNGFGINVVDTSNEIMGEGDEPHPAFMNVRQNKVGEPENLVRVLKGAIRNEGTIKLYADEVGYQAGDVELILQADRFGPSITSSVHGAHLQGVLENPTLMPMFGIQQREDGTRHIIGSPAFESFIEVRERNYFVLHRNLQDSVERILKGDYPVTEHIVTKVSK